MLKGIWGGGGEGGGVPLQGLGFRGGGTTIGIHPPSTLKHQQGSRIKVSNVRDPFRDPARRIVICWGM